MAENFLCPTGSGKKWKGLRGWQRGVYVSEDVSVLELWNNLNVMLSDWVRGMFHNEEQKPGVRGFDLVMTAFKPRGFESVINTDLFNQSTLIWSRLESSNSRVGVHADAL